MNMRNIIKEFRINQYLKVVLSEICIDIRFNERDFLNCYYIPINLDITGITPLDEVPAVNEYEGFLQFERDFAEKHNNVPLSVFHENFNTVPKEDIFWAQCSTFQVWEENDYNSNLLPNSIAFPLLRKLAELGDEKALKVFEEEIIKRLESNHLPTIYYLLEGNYLEFLSKENLEIQLNRLLRILDFEKLKNLKLDKKIRILENIISQGKGEYVHNFYKSEIIESFKKGKVKEIIDILWDVEENYLNIIICKDDIEEVFSNFDYDIITQEPYQTIESLLNILRILGFNDSEIFKKIATKALEIEHQDFVIEYLINEGSLNVISKEHLSSLNIKRLSFEGTELPKIPEELSYLESLEELDFYECYIASLPTTLYKLKNFKKLSLYNCVLRDMPTGIEKISSLEELEITYLKRSNQFLFLIAFEKLTSLKSLRLGGNDLTTLPKGIVDLVNLTKLDLNYNKLSTLPITFSHLKSLEVLNLEDNKMEIFPEIITRLTSLRELYIGGNQFHELPSSLVNLKSLEKLKFSPDHVKYGNFETLPEFLGNLKSLKELDVAYNNLKSLPTSIGNLKNLEILSLSHNRLTQLPNSIGNLAKLRSLDLSANKLKFLPESIKNIETLRNLNLNDNFFDNLPEASSRNRILYKSSTTDMKGIFQNVKFIDLNGEIDISKDSSIGIIDYIKNIIKESDLTKINALFWNNIFDKLSLEDFKELWDDKELSLLKVMLEVNVEIDKKLNLGDRMKRDSGMMYVNYPDRFIDHVSQNVGKKVTGIIENNNQTEIEVLIKLGYLPFLSEHQITSLFDNDKNIFSKMVLRWGYLDDTLTMKIEQFLTEKKECISQYIIQRWLNAFQGGNLEQIFNMWQDFWLGHCSENDFFKLISNPRIKFLNDLLKAIHHFGYKKKYDQTCALFPLLPSKFNEVAREKLKKNVIDVLLAHDIETFVPLLGTHMLDYLDSEDLLSIINEPEANFLENYLTALNEHNWELYYYNESFFLWNDKFRNFLKKFGVNVVENREEHFKIRVSSAFSPQNENDEYVSIASHKFYVKYGKLDLKECYIEDLNKVKGLFELTALKKLELGNNLLKEIPEDINKLKNLEFLSLSSNQLKKLPNSIGELKNLKTLDLSSNQIDQLPSSLGNLTSLEILRVDRNNLITIPNSLMRLHSLRELYLGSNNLISLPKHLFEFRNDDHIKGWINGVYHFEDQERIFQKVKDMKVLWETIGSLNSLEVLDLNRNRIDTIPHPLFQLKSLKMLNLDFNELKELPNELWNFENVTALSLGFNKLSSIPGSIHYLKNLEMLSLEYNNLESLPSSILELKYLKKINLLRYSSGNLSSNLGEIAKKLKGKGVEVYFG
ncbi:MAG: hypothetical protein GF311_19545 [Candidatus Lokiarchaeota archaeon]|nr:hypothetical protein [Candidatus Lokiarchaeota archaeon]